MNTQDLSKNKKTTSMDQFIELISKEIYYLDPLTHHCMKRSFTDRNGVVHYIGLLRKLPYYWDKTDNINIEDFLRTELQQLEDDDKELYRVKTRKVLQIILNHKRLFNKVRREAERINQNNNNLLDMKDIEVRTYNVLTENNITTIEQLTTFTQTELLGIRGIGKSILFNIELSLAFLGLSLRDCSDGTKRV